MTLADLYADLTFNFQRSISLIEGILENKYNLSIFASVLVLDWSEPLLLSPPITKKTPKITIYAVKFIA